MDLERQQEAIDLFYALAFTVERLPGNYRELALEYIAFASNRIRRESRRPKIIRFAKDGSDWVIEQAGRTLVIASQAKGLQHSFDILRKTQGHGRLAVEEITTASPNTLAKRLERARDCLCLAGAEDLAHYLKHAISVGQGGILVQPVPGFDVRPVIRPSSARNVT